MEGKRDKARLEHKGESAEIEQAVRFYKHHLAQVNRQRELYQTDLDSLGVIDYKENIKLGHGISTRAYFAQYLVY